MCDAVPAVPTSVALETVREDLGDVAIEGLDVSAVPVAAASLEAAAAGGAQARKRIQSVRLCLWIQWS